MKGPSCWKESNGAARRKANQLVVKKTAGGGSKLVASGVNFGRKNKIILTIT